MPATAKTVTLTLAQKILWFLMDHVIDSPRLPGVPLWLSRARQSQAV